MGKNSVSVPAFWLRRAGLADVYHAYTASMRAAEREANLVAHDLNAMTKVHNLASQERMGEYVYSHSPQGLNILIKNNRDIPTLNINEQVTYNAGRELFDNLWMRVNEVREASGKELVPYIDDYGPFMRAMTLAERLGKPVNLATESIERIMDNVTRLGDMQMQREKSRTGATYSAGFNYFRMIQDYTQQVLPQIHLAPFINKLDELIYHEMPNLTGGKEKTWLLSENKPNLFHYLDKWRNYLVNGHEPLADPHAEWFAQKLMRNTSNSMILYSATVAAVQPSTLVAAANIVGPRRLIWGALDGLVDSTVFFFKPEGTRLQRLYDNSGTIDTRAMQENFSNVSSAIYGGNPREFLRLLGSGHVGELISMVDKTVGSAPVQLLDHISAIITGLGAMRMADYIAKTQTKEFGGPILKGQKYWDFVDQVIVETNGGTTPGDVATIQRRTGGRFMTHMMRFVINDWNNIIENVIGGSMAKEIAQMMNRDPNKYVPAAVKAALMYAGMVGVYNFVQEDILGLRSGFGRPIKAAMKGMEKGEEWWRIARSVAGEVVSPVPGFGRARYTPEILGVGGNLLKQSYDAIAENPMSYKLHKPGDDLMQTAERIYGSPMAKLLGLRGAAAATRHMRAQDKQLGFWPSITGMGEDEAPKGSGGLQSGAGIVRTLR